MRLETAIWMFPIALTLHNLEEFIGIPAWSQHAGFWMSPVGSTEFGVAAGLLTVMGYAVTYWGRRAGKQSAGTYVMAGFVFAMLLNAFFHLGATVGLRAYAPGVVTALLINLPVMSYLLRRLFREKWITEPKAILAFILVPLGLLALIPVLLRVGRSI